MYICATIFVPNKCLDLLILIYLKGRVPWEKNQQINQSMSVAQFQGSRRRILENWLSCKWFKQQKVKENVQIYDPL